MPGNPAENKYAVVWETGHTSDMMLCAGAENRRSTSDSSKSLLVVALMQEDTHGEADTSEQENNMTDIET
jgi:hypothetical protein